MRGFPRRPRVSSSMPNKARPPPTPQEREDPDWPVASGVGGMPDVPVVPLLPLVPDVLSVVPVAAGTTVMLKVCRLVAELSSVTLTVTESDGVNAALNGSVATS